MQRLGHVEDPELETIKEVQNMLQESGDTEGTGSLAGQVTRLWASFLDDTWVWGGKETFPFQRSMEPAKIERVSHTPHEHSAP
jgi:hypothetical protein